MANGPHLEEIDVPPINARRLADVSHGEIGHAVERSAIADELVSLVASDTFAADQYRAVRHTIEWLRRESALHLLAVTSPSPGDGKSITTLNLAGALAQSPDTRVLVVDADLRRPSVARYLGLDADLPGLGDVLENTGPDLRRVVRRLERYNLSVVPAGSPRPSPYELLNSPRLNAFLTEARSLYDFVVVDTPPLVPLPDCRLIGKSVDAFLIVIAAHKTSRRLVTEGLNLMDPAKVVGIVFNGADRPRHHSGYYYYVNSSARQARWWHRAFRPADPRYRSRFE